VDSIAGLDNVEKRFCPSVIQLIDSHYTNYAILTALAFKYQEISLMRQYNFLL
jgi:hypothetical protein